MNAFRPGREPGPFFESSFGRGIIASRCEVEVCRDFCVAIQRFDPVDAVGLFTTSLQQPGCPPLQ